MRLSFFGQSYEASTTPAESTESEQIATFLGKSYRVKQHNVSDRSQPAQLKYRGVDYNN